MDTMMNFDDEDNSTINSSPIMNGESAETLTTNDINNNQSRIRTNNETNSITQTQATTRPRLIIEPLDTNLVGSRMMTRMKEVSLDALMCEDKVQEMNLNRNYIDVQLIRLITPEQKDHRASIYNIRRRNGGNNNSNQQVHFSRLLLCRLHPEKNQNEHTRLLYLMEAKNSNNVLFERNLEYRDDGTISIGSFFRILAPLPIVNSMRNDIPLVKTQLPIVAMKRPVTLTSTPISLQIPENMSMAFVLNGQTLHLNRTVPLQTTCSGMLCDRQRISEWSGNRRCGCYSMFQYRSNLALEHSICIDTQIGRISHQDFSSLKFDLLYLKSHIPANIKVSALRTSDEFWDIEDTIEKVLKFINGNGGFTVVGWYKRGEIKDRSLTDAPNVDSDNMNIGAGKVNYHIVQLYPTNQTILDPKSTLGKGLDELKYDVSRIRRV